MHKLLEMEHCAVINVFITTNQMWIHEEEQYFEKSNSKEYVSITVDTVY